MTDYEDHAHLDTRLDVQKMDHFEDNAQEENKEKKAKDKDKEKS